jgi:hypothetical protein
LPSILDYPLVMDRMSGMGMRCLYYNSGAFGPADTTNAKAVGWTGPQDASIRPEARVLSRSVRPPYEQTLTALALHAWQKILPGPLWFMPKSHWAYELDYGSRAWMPDLLRQIGVDDMDLAARTNASAIEFSLAEGSSAEMFLQSLLTNLAGSDFSLAWPDRPVICTVHHHKQLWWVTTDPLIHQQIDSLHPSQP